MDVDLTLKEYGIEPGHPYRFLAEQSLKHLHMIPEHCQYGVMSWVLAGEMTGDFLTAVMSNDLIEAFGRADDTNGSRLRDYCLFLYNYAPAGCYGSSENVARWRKQGGLRGKNEEAVAPR